jgi:hypothetical protein
VVVPLASSKFGPQAIKVWDSSSHQDKEGMQQQQKLKTFDFLFLHNFTSGNHFSLVIYDDPSFFNFFMSPTASRAFLANATAP